MNRIKIAIPSDVDTTGIKKRPVCGVIATAIAAGIPFTTAWKYYADKHENKYPFQGSLSLNNILKGLEHFGLTVERHMNCFGQEKAPIKNLARHLSLAYPGDMFVITTRKHVQLFWGTYLIDQQDIEDIDKYWAKGRRVIGVYRITNTEYYIGG